jgi:leucyl aminopeptidase
MSNKNPFEIRLEILKMAKEMMDQQYDQATSMWWSQADRIATATNQTMADAIEKSKDLMEARPTMYTPTEMMEKAQELYSFVSKKD